MNVSSFFGTDGIRGKTSLDALDEEAAIQRLEEERTLTPAFMRVLGEALSHTQPALPGAGEIVVIGWDRRPHNIALVKALTQGLRLTGSRVIHVGECATPTLHHAVLAFEARMGCMITASHNPVSDSGIKVFDANGYKSTRTYEQDVSRTLRQLASEDREVDATDRALASQPDEERFDWPRLTHPRWLQQRWALFEATFGQLDTARLQEPFLLDCSGGFAASWLAEWLTENGLACTEVSHEVEALNRHCGAGNFSPTQTWTHEEAAASSHALLKQLKPAKAGQWVGAALDGDGDRCLVVEATETGYKVVDGDAMGALLMTSGAARGWAFAASIESDVALMGYIASLNDENTCAETAVGDRWLSFYLRPEHGGLFEQDTMPRCLGIEDSGHAVMAAPCPSKPGRWSLVGDGAATLCAVLLASGKGRLGAFNRGWKRRVSITESHRERWHPDAEIHGRVEQHLINALNEAGFEAQSRRIDGEDNLLLIHATKGDHVVSYGIRNSGTQAKTSLSLRLSPGLDPTVFETTLGEVRAMLVDVLTEN